MKVDKYDSRVNRLTVDNDWYQSIKPGFDRYCTWAIIVKAFETKFRLIFCIIYYDDDDYTVSAL